MNARRLRPLQVLLALTGAFACSQQPSPEVQARIDSLSRAATERDRLMEEMAQNARLLSDVSADLARVQVRGKLNVSGESPSEAARDSVRQRVHYIATRLLESEGRLRDSERKVRSLTSISDSLRNTLQQTIANYDSVLAQQRDALAGLGARIDTLQGENVALKDTVQNLTTIENTVYYVVGPKDTLKQRGIIEETGGSRFLFILWKSGESIQPGRNLDPAAFTAIDRRQVTVITLPDSTKTYRIASRQDVSALATPPDKDGRFRGRIEIAQPQKFWSGSKFLIIVEA